MNLKRLKVLLLTALLHSNHTIQKDIRTLLLLKTPARENYTTVKVLIIVNHDSYKKTNVTAEKVRRGIIPENTSKYKKRDKEIRGITVACCQ